METDARLGRNGCQICGGNGLEEIEAFRSLPRVTSDVKPWPAGGQLAFCTDCGAVQKLISDHWLDEARQIYRQYEVYHQSGGVEQRVANAAGLTRGRSAQVVEWLRAQAAPGPTGWLLDYGCGNGAFIAAFADLYPEWSKTGVDFDDRHAAELARIPGFNALLHAESDPLPKNLDLISMIHALEHVVEPVKLLSKTCQALAARGRVLIDVPHWCDNPFDLVIADHVSHFEPASLVRLLERSGLAAVALTGACVPRETIALASRGGQEAATAPLRRDLEAGKRTLEGAVAWLGNVADHAMGFAKRERVGIFGTSIGGTWLFNVLEQHVDYFVDEDENRIGRRYLDRPVLSPRDVPSGGRIYVALEPRLSQAIAGRLTSGHTTYLPTPPI
jgi:SAM-dependent methyltransferase